ncbi:MAG: ATP-binding protein [Ignavibacteriales bacterium]|nr:ATP-binding protein [Ignavibacteriales bacterium]
MIKKIFTRNRIYFSLITFLLVLIIVSGIISPIILEKEKNDWDKILIDKTDFFENNINQAFDNKSSLLITTGYEVKRKLRSLVTSPALDRKKVINLIADPKFRDFSIHLYNSEMSLVAWNSEPILSSNELQNLPQFFNQTFFSGKKLFTYLSFVDTLKANEQVYTLVSSIPIEKHFSLTKKDEPSFNIVDSLSRGFSIGIEIEYSPFAKLSKDGRKYSFAVLNNFKNKIAVATFDKPSLELNLNSIRKSTEIIQYLLTAFIVMILGLWARVYLRRIDKKRYRFALFTVYMALLRTILFYFGIPSSFIHNSLTDASNFSSVFVFGMVRSPLEFFITVLFLLIIVLIGYKYFLEFIYNRSETKSASLFKTMASFIISILLFLLTYRGIGAAIRSVVFDSTIRYFKDFSLIPSPAILLMNFNILILGLSAIIFSLILITFIYSQYSFMEEKKKRNLLISLFILTQFCGWIFDGLQLEPQGTPLIRIVYITIVFVLFYLFLFNNKPKTIALIYYAFAASIISVSLLTYYNSEIERESLKTTAHELIRTDENMVDFMVVQTLTQAVQNERIQNSYAELKDLSSDAFVLWSNSLLYREGIRSAINFYDTQKQYLGGFETGKEFSRELFETYIQHAGDSLTINRQSNIFGDEKTFIGIAPVKINDQLAGYALVSAIYEEDYLNFAEFPKFIITTKAGISSVINLDKLKIFDFQDNQLKYTYGSAILSSDDENSILKSNFTNLDEAWLKLDLNGERNLIYALKVNLPKSNKILAIALEEKSFSWNLSDFFKIFFVHTIIIVSLLLIFSALRYKKNKNVLASYRTRLTGAFLVVSLIPLFLIAIYFRNLSEGKNSELVEKRLTELTDQVKSYISLYSNDSSLNRQVIFDKAARDLSISFSIYEDKNLIYDSHKVYSDIGLLPATLNDIVYLNCWLGRDQKLFLKEPIENYPVNSVYTLADISGSGYIIQVNDLFNRIVLPLSDVELDIFLFGIFSLAVILLVIFSTVLANQISSPIRKLTYATKSVGSGDLNVEVNYKTTGEIKELVDGFNQMVKRIKQSQSDLAQLERESAWKEMAKQVAHEIKNPLTPMKLSVQQLIAAHIDKSPKFDSIFEKVTSTIISQIEILKNIASEFSNFARMPRVNIEKLNGVETIRESLNLFEDEEISINFYCKETEIFINADQDQLKRTIVNLVRNSIQAGAKNIKTELSLHENLCEIRISDDGEGISKENFEKVFENNFTTKRGGMGLGLSMAKRFINVLGGTILVERSSNDEGTTILITIPLAN